MNRLEIFVPGTPKPGGSKRAFRHSKTGKVMVVDAGNNRDWKTAVAQIAAGAIKEPMRGALRVDFHFSFMRPASHYGTGMNAERVRRSAPLYPAKRPDLTKLIRSTEDACTGIVWRDDAQIVDQKATKRYVDSYPGCLITVCAIEKEN